MSTKNGVFKKILLCAIFALVLSLVFTGCELKDPEKGSAYKLLDNNDNYYNKDHTTGEEAVNEFTDSITALRKYLDSESFVDSGYYMGVDFDIDILDPDGKTAGHFTLNVKAYLYTYPYEDDEGNPIYKYYENGVFYDENNTEGTRTLVSALEIHNEVIKRSDFSIEWKDGASNEVLVGLYFDGINSNEDNPGNVLYANVQGYKRSFLDFGDTVLYQQMIRLLVNLSVEGLLESLGIQGDAGTGAINLTMTSLIGQNYKRVVNADQISLYFYSVTLDAIAQNVNDLIDSLLGVFGRKWDPMTRKFLGFKFSTVANALIQTIDADMQAIISPDKSGVTNVLTNAAFDFRGVVNSYDTLYTYTSQIRFDYGWTYPDTLGLDTDYYTPFDYGKYEFEGLLYVPSWDAQFDAEIKTNMQQYDNSTNNVLMEFRDIANGELMMGLYYREERSWLDISGLSYMYGWVDVESLGFPQVYDESLDLADVLWQFYRMCNNMIVKIVDSILNPATSDKQNKVLEYLMAKTSFTEKIDSDIFSINSETLQIDIELVKQMLEETGVGTFSTRQIINILDSMLPYTLDQIAIMLGIASAEVMLEKSYFTLTWDVDKQEFTIKLFTNVGIKAGEPSNMLFSLELVPVHFGEEVKIKKVDFTNFKPLGEIYTYSGTLRGTFIFSSQETVDLSKLLSATIGESSGLNTPYILAQNAGLTFNLVYDQFVKDQVVDGRLKKAKRSAFDLTVWLTGSNETEIIIGLASDDVCFDNEVYKDLPAREDELGYVWVNIACVTKNGTQVIPKVKIREDVFMASMYAYMNNQTSIEDDITSFADNDFNLSLTSIITALCKDAYVIPAADKLEITSSNETLQNLFRVNGLIGNIKVDAGFDYRVEGLESIRLQYYMYQVGYFDNIVGNSPYDTALHSRLPVYFYEDYMDDYDPLAYDFLVYKDSVILDDDAGTIYAGTIYLYQLGARRSVARQTIEYGATSFFNKEDDNNQDIYRTKFVLDELVLDPTKDRVKDNMLVYELDGKYYYRTYYGKQRQVKSEYIETGVDGTIYVYWLGISEVMFHDGGANFYYFDRNRAIEDADGNHVYITKKTDRNLLFEYDETSVEITEACKTQYAPRTNGSFMGEVRRYFIVFESRDNGELGKVDTLYYDSSTGYPQYYSQADEENVVEVYDRDGVLISSTKTPISLYVMEPCEPLAETTRVNVLTDGKTTQLKAFNSQYVIDWDKASSDKKGYMEVTDVIIAPGMMGEITFPVRIIVTNREIDAAFAAVTVYTEEEGMKTGVPVVDEIDVDPYDYVMKKYEYLSNTANFSPAELHNFDAMQQGYDNAVDAFVAQYFSQDKYAFDIAFKWTQSRLYQDNVGDQYVAKSYSSNDNGLITRYAWEFDSEPGNNIETSITPSGGTIYLHTKFKGQLIALKVNVGKREFSHVKFYSDDDFDPTEDGERDGTTINGLYRGNYYDTETYSIETRPIFVFTDGVTEYEHTFDMTVIRGLTQNSDETYSGTYNTQTYSLVWGNGTITNVTSGGSSYKEYTYSYVYKNDDFVDLDTRYDALTDAQKSEIVKTITGDGKIVEDNLYKKNTDTGRAKKRASVMYDELTSVYGLDKAAIEGTVFTIEYGNGKSTKYMSDRDGYAMIRNTDTEGDTEAVNRPFYYFYEKGNPDKAVYLSEEDYEKYNNGDAETRAKYGLNTDNSDNITTASMDLYYLFRLYFALDNKLYAISTLSNEIIETSKLNDQAIGATGFSILELRVSAECPQLEIAKADEEPTDELTKDGGIIKADKVEEVNPTISGKAQGYYRVDPLNSETLYLPDSMRIFFEYQTFTSSHVFSGLEWCAYFDENGNPVYTYTDKDGATQTLIEKVVEKGKTRYKIAIDVSSLTGELVFRAMFKIGNAYSGYREVTVAVKILSKDPLNVDFYDNYGVKLDTPKTKTEISTGSAVTKLTYYTYYVNTFEDFKLPTTLIAQFAGHEKNYDVSWKVAKPNGSFVFPPDSLVTLFTTIGTEGGVQVDIYLVIAVENYELSDVEVNNDFGLYYVTVENDSGSIREDKVRIKDLFNVGYKEFGYYMQDSQRWYIRISTGSTRDDAPGGEIALYTVGEESGRPVFAKSVELYEFISTLYSKATLTLTKNEINFNKQAIVGQNDSIFDLSIKMRSKQGSEGSYKLSEVAQIGYSYKDQEDVMTIKLEYTNSGEVFYALADENGMYTVASSSTSRKITYTELASYLINERITTKYGDMLVVSVDGNTADTDQKPFEANLSEYVRFNSDTKKIVYGDKLGFGENGTIVLKDASRNEYTFSYRELTFMLERYYRYVRTTSGTKKVISGKSIGIKGLYEKMSVNEMLVGKLSSTDNQNKYVVSLGTGTGSYDMKANLRFTGGYYLTTDSQNKETVNVKVYTTSGAAAYESGYVLGNNISANLTATINDGTGNTRTFSYNNSATDEKLEYWYVESLMNIDGVNVGDVITAIPAAAIYSTGKIRQITLSALTSEGFRVNRTIEFEIINDSLTSNFSGGNSAASFAETKKFAIVSGLITVNNVYDLAQPSVIEYLGSTDYLPTTLTVGMNGRQITVADVKWKLNASWYGGKDSTLSKLTYKGTSGNSYVMATSDILGYSDGSGGKAGTTKIYLYIKVNSAEVTVLPWESADYGNGLATETVNDGSSLAYRVYVDAYDDADAVKSGILRLTDDADVSKSDRRWFVDLPSVIPAQYSDGSVFEFSDVRYFYDASREVQKIYFDYRGMDVSYMASSKGDLSGVSTNLLSERYLDLIVDLGLGQKLSVRFCFYNKRVKEITPMVSYASYTDENGNKVKYSTLTDEQKQLTIAGSEIKTYRNDADGYVEVATVAYYREQYYELDASGTSVRKEYAKLSEDQKNEVIEGTTLNKFVQDGVYALETKLVYNDVSAVVDIDDSTIRTAVYNDMSSDLNVYRISLLNKVNTIRAENNLKEVISAAQSIKSLIRSAVIDCGIESVPATSAEISAKLLAWTKTISYKGSYDESSLPYTETFDAKQSYNFALANLIEAAEALAYYDETSGNSGEYVVSVKKTIDGGGSATAKQKDIDAKISAYFEKFTQNGFNAAIRKLVEREYEKLFSEEMSGMSDDERNDAVYYKNMIEAGFDVDGVLKDVYKLRSLKNAGTDVGLAAKQIDVSLAEENGFGTDTYEELAYAAFAQALFEAYEYADGLMTVKDENYEKIRETVIKILENRLDIAAAKTGAASGAASGAKNATYTLSRFVSVWAYGTDEYITKKNMRTYLVNVMREAATFTDSKGTADWNAYYNLSSSLVAYSYNYISNYAATVNSIRKSLVSGSSVTSLLNNLIAAGITSYTNNIYAESEYVSVIKAVQETNGQIFAKDKYDGGTYSATRFKALIDEYTAKYFIEPYYSYRAIPHKILIYFDGDDSVADESGRPYETSITWTTDPISGGISYLGKEGTIAGTITSPVTGETATIHIAAAVEARVLGDAEKVVTTQYALDGLAFVADNSGDELTTDKKYAMEISNSKVYFCEYEYDDNGQVKFGTVRYSLLYADVRGVNKVIKFSGYDKTGAVIYSFINEYDEYGNVKEQSLYVYNPFEFNQDDDMPSTIRVSGESLKVRWDKLRIQPTGNLSTITSDGKATITGKVGSSAGQTVEINMYVAQWSYAGLYRKTDTEAGEEFTAEGETKRFIYMGSLNMYFSAYSLYSAEDYYLAAFGVKIYMPDDDGNKAVRRIVFEDEGRVKEVVIRDSDDGFVRKLFYPEDSRLLEYALDDESMELVNDRKRYVIYWESMRKNKAINEQTTVTDCLVFLGNSDIGQFSLDGLKESGDAVAPTKATYSCEKMSVSELSFATVGGHSASVDGDKVTVSCEESGVTYVIDSGSGEYTCSLCGEKYDASVRDGNFVLVCGKENCRGHEVTMILTITEDGAATVKCENRACVLFEEIGPAIMGQDSQATVVISPDGYFPTTGEVNLKEINVFYNKEELRVRYLWNVKYEAVISGLVPFIKYAYPDVEDATVRTYAKNLLMTWDIITESERREIIEKAKEYERSINEYRGDDYTDALCQSDAYALLAIYEKYKYAEGDNKLRGGGSSVEATVLIGVEGSSAIYSKTVKVKTLFADYSPLAYYTKSGASYKSIMWSKDEYDKDNSGSYSDLYIGVRKDYWYSDGNESKSMYEQEGVKNIPYDNIDANAYKLLQIYAERSAIGKNAEYHETITESGKELLLVRISDITWQYDENTNRLTSEKFTIGGVEYESSLLVITLN